MIDYKEKLSLLCDKRLSVQMHYIMYSLENG